MIKKPSYLKLNRLVITKAGKQLYDEKFHDGINIIRGEHSVGKSTILDMIFYVLGGELKKTTGNIQLMNARMSMQRLQSMTELLP